MKQKEKLDLIVKTLYKFRDNGSLTIEKIYEKLNIPLNSRDEIYIIAERLRDDGYIKVTFTKGTTFAIITSYGIGYCEEDLSFSKNISLINNTYNTYNINNSSNNNIVSNSSNVTIAIQNYPEIEIKFKEIQQAILINDKISATKRENILALLQDIKASLEAGNKPKMSFEVLLSNVANFATLTSSVLQLRELIFR